MDKQVANPIEDTGQRGFLMWLQRYQPYMYREVMRKLPKAVKMGSLGADATIASTTGASPGWMDTVKNIITAAGQAWMTKEQVDAQQKLLKMQLDRARAGLSPLDLDPSAYGLPGANVSVGLSSDVKQMLMIGAAGIAAIFLLPKLMGGKRAR